MKREPSSSRRFIIAATGVATVKKNLMAVKERAKFPLLKSVWKSALQREKLSNFANFTPQELSNSIFFHKCLLLFFYATLTWSTLLTIKGIVAYAKFSIPTFFLLSGPALMFFSSLKIFVSHHSIKATQLYLSRAHKCEA